MARFGSKDSDGVKQSSPPEVVEALVYDQKIKQSEEDIPVYEVKTTRLTPSLALFRDRVFEKLVAQIDLSTASRMQRQDLKNAVERFVGDQLIEASIRLSHIEQTAVVDDIVNDMIGLGPLEVLVNDPAITDILVNGHEQIYVEHRGKLHRTNVHFRSDKHVLQMAQRIANYIGRRVDETSPMVDARLKDGSRVNVIVPPVSLDGVSISIRKFSKTLIGLDQMVAQKNLSKPMKEFLEVVARCRVNIIVSGGTGSGKTTLLNALSRLIDPKERIVTIEDAAELRLAQPHVVRLESRPPNIEGVGEVSIRELLKNALRMRPDRIVVGECRGAEAFDMLQAMNTGHDGSMSTIHANNADETLHRLENMLLMTGHALPNHVIRSYIADAVNLVVHVARMRDGIRRVTQITEVFGMEGEDILHQDIFRFEYDHDDDSGAIIGRYVCCQKKPHLFEKAKVFSMDKPFLASLRDEAPAQ